MSYFHHRTVFCLLLLGSQASVFTMLDLRRKEPKLSCGYLGSRLTDSVPPAHGKHGEDHNLTRKCFTPLRTIHSMYYHLLRSDKSHCREGRSWTPLPPFELGSGAWLRFTENNFMCTSSLEINQEPGLPATPIPLSWADGTAVADRQARQRRKEGLRQR